MRAEINNQFKKGSVAWYKGRLLSWKIFEEHVAQVRQIILKPHVDSAVNLQKPKVLNLCEDKYHFLVVFTASMMEGRSTVMPSNRSAGEISRMIKSADNIQLISDAEIVGTCQYDLISEAEAVQWDISSIPESMVVAELYSSGSTGKPSVNPKSWGQLIDGAQQVYSSLAINHLDQPSLIATVPPQHMFGFEMCIVLVLVCGVTIHHEQPFYPLDIQRALDEMPSPRVMITTPIHLKACNILKTGWPDIEFVISATAPLLEQVAQKSEQIMKVQVKEIYGCSEVGAIATRRVMDNPDWKLLADYSIIVTNDDVCLSIPSKTDPVILPDKLELLSEKHFRLVGRNSDLIKIGGKRGSLVEITLCIKALPGVQDAVVFHREVNDTQNVRLAALIVTKKSTEQLRKALLRVMDPVFLPRPLCVVSALPYNSIGKLPRAELLLSLDHYLLEQKA